MADAIEKMDDASMLALMEKLAPEAIERLLTLKILDARLDKAPRVAQQTMLPREWSVPVAGQLVKLIVNKANHAFLKINQKYIVDSLCLTFDALNSKCIFAVNLKTKDLSGADTIVMVELSETEPV